MFQQIVQAIVPDDFVEIRPVKNLVSGRNDVSFIPYLTIYENHCYFVSYNL